MTPAQYDEKFTTTFPPLDIFRGTCMPDKNEEAERTSVGLTVVVHNFKAIQAQLE